jgi:hypothetical protein
VAKFKADVNRQKCQNLDRSERSERRKPGDVKLAWPRQELSQAGVFNQLIQRRKGEYLATGRQQDLAHVLAPHTKASTIDACDELERCLTRALTVVPHGRKIQDAADLVARRAVVAGDLGLDDGRWRNWMSANVTSTISSM